MKEEMLIERSSSIILGQSQTRTDYVDLVGYTTLTQLDVETLHTLSQFNLEQQLEKVYKHPSKRKYLICQEYEKLKPRMVNLNGAFLNVFKTYQFIYSYNRQFITIGEYVATDRGVSFLVYNYPTHQVAYVVTADECRTSGDLFNHLKYRYSHILRDLINRTDKATAD